MLLKKTFLGRYVISESEIKVIRFNAVTQKKTEKVLVAALPLAISLPLPNPHRHYAYQLTKQTVKFNLKIVGL